MGAADGGTGFIDEDLRTPGFFNNLVEGPGQEAASRPTTTRVRVPVDVDDFQIQRSTLCGIESQEKEREDVPAKMEKDRDGSALVLRGDWKTGDTVAMRTYLRS